MRTLIFTASPNKDGLTASCAKAANEGVESTGNTADIICLNDLDVGKCQACDNGWGTCNKVHECQVIDDFQKLHQQVKDYDNYVIITPVYYGQMSESAKAFFDRLRRCEATRGNDSILKGKSVIAVAAAGGSGNGIDTCLFTMERLISHLQAIRFDLVGITQKNRSYKINTIVDAVAAMTV